MRARSIDPSTVEPSGATSVAPITSLPVPFRKPTQMSTTPLLLAPFESQPFPPALPGRQGCASAVKPSGNTTGAPLAAGEPLGAGVAAPLGSTLAVALGTAATLREGDGLVSIWPVFGSSPKTPARTAPPSSARTPSARKPRIADRKSVV